MSPLKGHTLEFKNHKYLNKKNRGLPSVSWHLLQLHYLLVASSDALRLIKRKLKKIYYMESFRESERTHSSSSYY